MSISVDIVKRFDGFCLDVHFASAGGTLGILGASGSGKSMTLKCIAGLETPDEGRIVVNGRVLFDAEQKVNLRPQQRKAGYLFQSYALFPNMTVAGNIACAVPGRRGEKKPVVRQLMKQYGLEELANRLPDELSGGQQQRTALARLLASRPDVLLLDEPFAALDAHLRENLQVRMKELLAAYRRDAILVTHDRGEAYRLCETLLIIDNGRVALCDETRHVFQAPRKTAAARLLGCKNISKANICEGNCVKAVQWNTELRPLLPVSKHISHVSVRPEDFFLLERDDVRQTVNVFNLRVIDTVAGQYGNSVLLSCGGSEHAGETLFWAPPQSGEQPVFAPGSTVRLGVAPENILMLEDE